MTTLPYVVADVFASAPLEGNPLAVFVDAEGLGAASMQALARETNLSETTFVLPARDGGDARCRIFTPNAELAFAGHPILGTAAVLAQRLDRRELVLETGSGPVRVVVAEKAPGRFAGSMEQPIPTWESCPDTDAVLAALGVGAADLPVEVYDNGPRHTMVALADESDVAALRPDLPALAALGVQVSCFAGSGERWKARYFGPALGVPEDPATGSAAGPLAIHLARHGRIAFGTEIAIHQGVEIGRPSLLRAVAHGDRNRLDRVEVAGSVVIVARGEFTI